MPRWARIPWVWLGFTALIAFMVIVGQQLPADEWLREIKARIDQLGPESAVIYAFLYAAAAVLFVPGWILTIGAGFICGVGRGAIAASLGSTMGAAISFLIARYVARDKVASFARRNEKFRAVDYAIERQGWKIVFLLRLNPFIPFNLSNYLYGLTAIPFRPYLLASWIAMFPETLLYVYLGAGGKAGFDAATGQGALGSLHLILVWVGLLATVIATWSVSRLARRALRRSDFGEGL